MRGVCDKVSKSTLYKVVREGKVPCQKVGRHWRFRKEAIDRWLEQGGVPSPAAGAGAPPKRAARRRAGRGDRARLKRWRIR